MLSLALTGTTSGLLIGKHCQEQALAAQSVAIAQRKLLSDLQVDILYNRPTKQFSPYLDNWNSIRSASGLMLGRVDEIQRLLESRNRIEADKRQLPTRYRNLSDATSEVELQRLLDDYEVDLAAFRQRLQNFLRSVELISQTSTDSTDLTKAQTLLIEFVQDPAFADFVQLPKDLVPFVSYVEAQERAASVSLSNAIALQTQIIFASLLISVIIASLLASYTSRAIAYPIQTLTQLTHRITKESNFSLKVPVLGEGAVAILADSFNQLIAQVNLLLSEVSQKNGDLETALHQLKKQQNQLIRAEKMSSLGQLVAGIAHEINNPVGFIHGNLRHVDHYTQTLLDLVDLYQSEYPHPPEHVIEEIEDIDLDFVQEDLPRLLSSMKTGTQRISQIVLSLRSFSRMDESVFKSVDIHEGIESSLLILQHLLIGAEDKPMIAVERDYDKLPLVTCSVGELNQVFMNVLVNAIEALHTQPLADNKTPKITIRTCVLLDDWVQIEIADNGLGMSEAVSSQIFEPFFTTKPVGQGTGMGLSLCYQIITETHQGKLTCLSAPGEGTSIMIQIPCCSELASA